jgi:hypothetical protein
MEKGAGEAESVAPGSGVERSRDRWTVRARGVVSDWARRKKIALVFFRWTVRRSSSDWSVGSESKRQPTDADSSITVV